MRKSTVFAQLMQLINKFQFKKSVNKHDGDRYTKSMDCLQQLIILLYTQVRGIKSLRDIEVSLRSQSRKWYHLGLESVARSTLSDANAKRSSEIFKELFYNMLDKCQQCSPGHRFKLDTRLFTMDSTTIGLCLSSFPWAKYRARKGVLKIHTLLNPATAGLSNGINSSPKSSVNSYKSPFSG